MRKGFSAAFVVCLMVVSAAYGETDLDFPKVRNVAIQKEITRDIIDILPGRGVKVIFPWVLSKNSSDTPFKAWITNDAVFKQIDEEGQNYILYKLKVNDPRFEGEMCDAFVNAHGYHFSFTLRVSFSRKDHYSDIIVKLSDADKYELIEKAVQRRMKALTEEYDKKEKELDQRAKRLSLKLVGKLATHSPKKSSVYETEKLKLTNGDQVIFKADRVFSYGDIHVVQIEVENDSMSNPLYINGLALEKTSGDTAPLISEFELPPRIEPGEEVSGFAVTQDERVVNGDDTQMSLYTDKGTVVLQW